MKTILTALGAFALLLVTAPAFAAPDAPAASLAVPEDCGVDLAQIMAAQNAAVCSENDAGNLPGSAQPAPLALAVSPHCCTTADVDACRTLCRQQPSCKGSVHCTAGECVCACSC